MTERKAHGREPVSDPVEPLVMFTVYIKNNRTGEIRQYLEKDYVFDDGQLYMWQEGNYSCDCNRALFFSRAIGEDETEAWEQKCGDQIDYSVLFIELPDGTRITDIDETY